MVIIAPPGAWGYRPCMIWIISGMSVMRERETEICPTFTLCFYKTLAAYEQLLTEKIAVILWHPGLDRRLLTKLSIRV
jgi:hypothetical protein